MNLILNASLIHVGTSFLTQFPFNKKLCHWFTHQSLSFVGIFISDTEHIKFFIVKFPLREETFEMHQNVS